MPSPSTSTAPPARAAATATSSSSAGDALNCVAVCAGDDPPGHRCRLGLAVAEALVVDAVVEVVGVQVLEVVQRRVDVALPDLGGDVVQHLESVPVGIGDVGGVGHPVVAADDDLDAVRLHVPELAEPRLPIGVADGDVVDPGTGRRHRPRLGRRHLVGVLDLRQGEVVVVRRVASVEAHRHRVGEVATLLEPHHLGVEAMRTVDVPDVEHQVVDAGCRRCRHAANVSGDRRQEARATMAAHPSVCLARE